jgi:hypothetical protein
VGGIPLHPALVHIPLGLALLLPLLAMAAVIAWWRGRASKGTWAAVVVLQCLLVASGWFGIRTGEREVRRARQVVAREYVHEHSEAADFFVYGAGAVLVVGALGLVLGGRGARWAATAAAVGTLVVAAMGVRVGHLGGRLVYVHGAATPYVTDSIAVSTPMPPPPPRVPGPQPGEKREERR